jgi:hypothetical protein
MVAALPEYRVNRKKVGSSIVTALPKKLLEAEQVEENMAVKITVQKCRINGFGIFKGMAPFTPEDELEAHE